MFFFLFYSLANVILQGMGFSKTESEDGRVAESEGKVPGFLRFMRPDHIQILMDALQQSYTAAVEFDRRPGLKFLIQKVAQAERAANLYKQAGASWTLRMVTLFDLTLSQVKHGLGLNEVKEVLEKDVRAKNTLKRQDDKEEETEGSQANKVLQRPTQLLKNDTIQYIQMLRASFTELCEVYLDLVIDKDGHYSAVDKINDQPIFFLTVQPDEFPTGHRKSLAQWTKSLEEFNKQYIKGKTKDSEVNEEDKEPIAGTMTIGAGPNSTSLPGNHPKKAQEQNEVRPFTLADFAREYSSDSEDSESPEFAETIDSGVASLAGEEISILYICCHLDIHLYTSINIFKVNMAATIIIPTELNKTQFSGPW